MYRLDCDVRALAHDIIEAEDNVLVAWKLRYSWGLDAVGRFQRSERAKSIREVRARIGALKRLRCRAYAWGMHALDVEVLAKVEHE